MASDDIYIYTYALGALLNCSISFHKHDDYFKQAWKNNPCSRRFTKRIASRNCTHDTALAENMKLVDRNGMLFVENLKLGDKHGILLT